MKFDKLWDIIKEKNKNLQCDKEVRMTVNGFEKALRLSYEKGYDEGYEQGANSKSTFEQMFGKNKF